MARRLEWSARARQDVAAIEAYYALVASPRVAGLARDAIVAAALKIWALPADFRSGKPGTREYVMRPFPYTVVYRANADVVRIVRVMHQSRRYFNG